MQPSLPSYLLSQLYEYHLTCCCSPDTHPPILHRLHKYFTFLLHLSAIFPYLYVFLHGLDIHPSVTHPFIQQMVWGYLPYPWSWSRCRWQRWVRHSSPSGCSQSRGEIKQSESSPGSFIIILFSPQLEKFSCFESIWHISYGLNNNLNT